MKKNNKGFMLVEVIITSTVILTAMVGLYTSFNKLYKNYNVRNTYYYLDGIYATKEMFNRLIGHNFNAIINKKMTDDSFSIIENGKCNVLTDDNSCLDILEFYEIDNMVFVEYNKSTLKELVLENETFEEYVAFVIKYYDIKDVEEEYNYLFLTEICKNEDCYYSNLRVR